MAACERFLTDAEDRNIDFMVRLFQKQLQRLTVTLDQFIVRLLVSSTLSLLHSAISTDIGSSSRAGESSQVDRRNQDHHQEAERSRSLRQALPSSSLLLPPLLPQTLLADDLPLASSQVFIDLFESQLVGTDGLEIRATVDASYEKIANVMFESLQQLAKMDGAEGLAHEDKGQLNYHVILIGTSLRLLICECRDRC